MRVWMLILAVHAATARR